MKQTCAETNGKIFPKNFRMINFQNLGKTNQKCNAIPVLSKTRKNSIIYTIVLSSNLYFFISAKFRCLNDL